MLADRSDDDPKKFKVYLSNDLGPALLIIFVVFAISHRDQVNCAVGAEKACAEINERYEEHSLRQKDQ